MYFANCFVKRYVDTCGKWLYVAVIKVLAVFDIKLFLKSCSIERNVGLEYEVIVSSTEC
jgi:hypothetical protein